MKKEVQIAYKIDTSQFDQSVAQMQRKLRDIQAGPEAVKAQQQTSQRLQGMGMGGIMSAPSMEAYRKATQQTRRELDQLIREQAQGQEKLGRMMAQRADSLKQLKTQQEALVRGSAEELKIREKIARVTENNYRLNEMYRQRDIALNRAMDARQGGQASGGPGMFDASLKGILSSLTTALTAVATGSALVQNYAELPMQRSMALGGATQGLFGQQLQDLNSGQVVSQSAFLSERQKAMGTATDIMKTREKTDIGQEVSLLMPLIKGATGDTRLMNKTIGDALQVLGKTWIGEAISMISPNLISNASERFQSTYHAQTTALSAEDYQKSYEAEVAKNPLKNLAATTMEQNSDRFLQMQRTLGLGYAGYHGKGGYREQATAAGFTPEMAEQMSVQMQAAGSGTVGMRGSVLALQAQRGFDLTNAGAVLGRISGGAGGSGEEVFKRLLEEAVRLGLNKSEMVEEQRKFADITSEILSRGGVSTSTDAQRVLQGFSGFVGGNPTMRELEGAKSAYGQYQKFSGETGGRGGALQFAALTKRSGLEGLGPMAAGSLMETPEQDLISTNPLIITEAVKLGISPDALAREVVAAKREKAQVEVGLDPGKMKALGAFMKARGLPSTLNEKQLKKLKTESPEMFEAYERSEVSPTLRYDYESPQQREAAARRYRTMSDLGVAGGKKGLGAEVEKKLRDPETGRVEDKVQQARAVESQAFIENMRKFKGAITPNVDALKGATKQLILFTAALQLIPDKDKAAAQKHMEEQMSAKISNQVQAGRVHR